MPRRRDAATAATGYGLVAAGGTVRGSAVDDAHRDMGYGARRVRPASLAVLQASHNRLPGAGRIARRFGAGTALVAIGAPAAAVGTSELLRRHKVNKADQHKNILTEGVQGTGDALKSKAESVRSGAPAHVRAEAIALGAAGAGAGSLLAHRGLDGLGKLVKINSKVRSATTAAAAIPGALATLPASRHLARKSGYTVTPTGTKKVSKATQEYKHNDYLGRHVAPGQQRVRVLAAGATPGPLLGPIAAAHQAGRYAPPGQRKRAEARQFSGGPVAGGVAGLYAGKRVGQLAEHSPRAESGVRRALGAAEKAHGKLPAKVKHLVPLKTAAHLTPKKAGAVAGFVAGHAIVGAIGGQVATNRNLTAERKYNAHHPVSKGFLDDAVEHMGARVKAGRAAVKNPPPRATPEQLARIRAAHPSASKDGPKEISKFTGRLVPAKPKRLSKLATNPGMTDKQKGQLVRRKKASAVIGTASAGAGLTALSMIGSKVPATIERRNKLLAVGAGLSGIGALNSASVARREAKAEKSTITKAAPIQTTMNDKEAHNLTHGPGGYGIKGPLPSHLDRPTRMKAYEARYVASGGKKSQRWQHVAQGGQHISTAGVAGATAAGLALIGSKSTRVKALTAPLHKLKHFEHLNSEKVKEKAEHAAVVSATAGGVGQLVNQGAKHRRAKYTSAPGGVAASNLRRMQAYSPGG